MNYIHHLNAFFSYVKTDSRLTCAHVSLYMALFQYWNYNRFRNSFPIYRDSVMGLSKIGSKDNYYRCIKELHQAGYIFYNPSVSKYQPVKISVVRLDKSNEKDKAMQLDIFSGDEKNVRRNPKTISPENDDKIKDLISDHCPDIGTHDCPENRTVYVLNSVPMSPESSTVCVLNSGHLIKQNIINSVCKHTQLLEKNKKIAQSINGLKSIPNINSHQTISTNEKNISRMLAPPKMEEVETFFSMHSYPIEEAKKFFYYNNGKAWMLNNATAILDWQSLAHKWMLNEKTNCIKKQQTIYQVETNKDYSIPL